jgi:hypothetical protein
MRVISDERFPKRPASLDKKLSWSCCGMSWLVMVLTSLIILRTSIADAAKEVYVDRTDVVEGMLVRENMLMGKICMETDGSGIKEA